MVSQVLVHSKLDMNPTYLKVAPEIRRALQGGRPVVALESTIITHGMPVAAGTTAAIAGAGRTGVIRRPARASGWAGETSAVAAAAADASVYAEQPVQINSAQLQDRCGLRFT